MVSKLGEPMVRSALYAAMRIMGKQFVLGRTIHEALKASEQDWEQGIRTPMICSERQPCKMLMQNVITSVISMRFSHW